MGQNTHGYSVKQIEQTSPSFSDVISSAEVYKSLLKGPVVKESDKEEAKRFHEIF